jgi:hypothetical protein
MDIGSAMIYRTTRVKLHSRKMFPTIPHTSDVAFNAMHLAVWSQ